MGCGQQCIPVRSFCPFRDLPAGCTYISIVWNMTRIQYLSLQTPNELYNSWSFWLSFQEFLLLMLGNVCFSISNEFVCSALMLFLYEFHTLNTILDFLFSIIFDSTLVLLLTSFIHYSLRLSSNFSTYNLFRFRNCHHSHITPCYRISRVPDCFTLELH